MFWKTDYLGLDQTKEDFASKFCKRREKIANFSPVEDRRQAFIRKSPSLNSD